MIVRSILSKKEHSKVLLLYDAKLYLNVVEKIIHREALHQLLYYQQILRTKSFYSLDIELQQNIKVIGNFLYVKGEYYACNSLKSTIIDLNIKNKYILPLRMVTIFTNLMKIFIQDGNRQFIPTSYNIFIEETAAYVNLYSLVGIDLFKCRSCISKDDFIEIAPMIPPSILLDLQAGKQVDYVKIKQRALLLVFVSMVENKQFVIQKQDQIPLKLTLEEVKKYIVQFNNFLIKYLSSPIFKKKLSERKIPLNIYDTIQKIIIQDASKSWPELIELLVANKQSCQLFAPSLCFIAQAHWRQLPIEQKYFLQQSKIVSASLDGITLQMKHISLYLTIYTKTPLSMLLSEGSFSAILRKDTNFDLVGCTTIMELINIINKFEEKSRNHQAKQSRQQSKETRMLEQQKEYGISLEELIRIAKNKMVKKITRSNGRSICVQHPILRSLRMYSLALR